MSVKKKLLNQFQFCRESSRAWKVATSRVFLIYFTMHHWRNNAVTCHVTIFFLLLNVHVILIGWKEWETIWYTGVLDTGFFFFHWRYLSFGKKAMLQGEIFVPVIIYEIRLPGRAGQQHFIPGPYPLICLREKVKAFSHTYSRATVSIF